MTAAADQNTAVALEPMHDRKLSHSNSFTTASESPLPSPASSPSLPSSCEKIPGPELDRQSSSLSSTSSYESFYQIDTAANHESFVPATTLAPAVQTMMAPPVPGYDPKRLPSSMFRTTQSTCAAEWSAASDQSLFSIQLENSGEIGGPLYGVGDLYYDAAGVFHRLSSATRLPTVPEASPKPGSSAGVCV